MRTAYLGTSAFAARVLAQLADSSHRPSLVITRPDRPRGRGRTVTAPPVADAARELGLQLEQPEDVGSEEARARIAAVAPETICVCAFGALVKEPLLSEYPMLNVHPSLLPRWRGAAPIERSIMAGDTRTGVSIMTVTAGLDSGPVHARQEIPIAPDDTYGTLSERLATAGGELLVQVLDHPREEVPQDDELATYAEKITAADRRLDPGSPAIALERAVRALTPHIGAFVVAEPVGRLGVRRAVVLAGGRGRRPARWGWTDPGRCSARSRARWSYSPFSRPVAGGWTAPTI